MNTSFGQTCFGLVFAHQPFIFISASFTTTALLRITLGQTRNQNYLASALVCACVCGGGIFFSRYMLFRSVCAVCEGGKKNVTLCRAQSDNECAGGVNCGMS